MDSGDQTYTAEDWTDILMPELLEIFQNDLSRIKSVCTDTEATMRATHNLLQQKEELKHVIFSLCDSHGLQLLIKDLLNHQEFEELVKDVGIVLAFFSRSKIQLNRLRSCQKARWAGTTRALIRSVISRWGTQNHSFLPFLRSRDPLCDWTTLLEVQKQLKLNDPPVLLPEVIRILRSHSFWNKLEAAAALLKPVHNHQIASEADGSTIHRVVERWLQIQHRWKEMKETVLYPDLPWDDIEAIHKAHFDKQTYETH